MEENLLSQLSKSSIRQILFLLFGTDPCFLEEVCSWQVLFPNALHCNSNPSNLTSFWHYQIGERSTSAWGSGCRGECLLHSSQLVLTSQWLISIFMLKLHVETFPIAQETDVGSLTQISKLSEYMNTGIYVAFISHFLGWSWLQIIFLGLWYWKCAFF